MIIDNRSGEAISPNIGVMGVLDILTKDFTLPDNIGFLIKNEAPCPISLRVRLACMSDEEDPIDTIFYPGWSSEIVKFVECNKNITSNLLKYGY